MPNPVLVVGAGPVGLTLAGELLRYRVPVRIIDQERARTDKSKALVVWARTLELLDRAGAAEAFVDAGLKIEAATIRSGDTLIARVPFDAVPSRFSFLLAIPQSETERLLEAHLERLGGKVEREVTLELFTDSGAGPGCVVRRADGSTETIEARFLIGCDGAHSTVRKALGMAFEGDTLATSFILADVRVEGVDALTKELSLFWHEDGIIGFFPMPGGRCRIIADMGASPRRDPTFDEVKAVVERRGPAGLTISDPVWLAGFVVNERKVRDYRLGRVFVAGDAAHVHSPAGGQGMNTGMQDAFNLAWKLALTETGAASPDLLDSYSAERSPVAAQILADSGRMTRAALLRNPVLAHVRDFVAHTVLGFADVQHAMANRLEEITIGYPASPLNAGAAHGLSGPGPGERIVAAAPFGAADRPRFALMARDSEEAHAVVADFAALVEPALRPPPDEAGMWLVRPDGYVAAVARAGEGRVIRDCLAKIAAPAA